MAAFALYLIAVLFGAAGLCGHTPVLTRLARQAYAWLTRRASRDSRITAVAPSPPTARTEPRRYPSWSQP